MIILLKDAEGNEQNLFHMKTIKTVTDPTSFYRVELHFHRESDPVVLFRPLDLTSEDKAKEDCELYRDSVLMELGKVPIFYLIDPYE